MWCVAELDEKYIERMEDVLALYERPYDAAEPVVCLDEKPVSLHKEVRPPRPAAPGHTAKRDNEYRRCGTANVFAWWSRKPAGISPMRRQIERRRSSRRHSDPCWIVIPRRGPST